MSISRRAGVALVVAFLLMIPLTGSALAKPLIVDDFGDKMEAIEDAIEDVAEDSDVEIRDNHGWWVSQLASDFNNMMDEADLDLEGLNRGHWISMFSRYLKKGEDLSGALMAKAEVRAERRAAVEEKKQNRLEAASQDDDDDDDVNDDDDDVGSIEDDDKMPPGQAKKGLAGSSADDKRSDKANNRAQGNVEEDDDDTEEDVDDTEEEDVEEDEGLGRDAAPGQAKKLLETESDTSSDDSTLNNGQLKKAAKTAKEPK